MTSMDFRFPELSAPRDPQPDSVSRARERADSDFADYLDASLRDRRADEPREPKVREAAPRQTPAARDERDDKSVRAPSDTGEKSDHVASADTSSTPSPAPQPAEKVETAETVKTTDTAEIPKTAETSKPVETPIAVEAGPAAADVVLAGADHSSADTPAPPQDAPRAPAQTAAAPPIAPAQNSSPAPPLPAHDSPLDRTGTQARQTPAPAAPANEPPAAMAQSRSTAPQAPTFAGELAAAQTHSQEAVPAHSKPQGAARAQPAAGQTSAENPVAPDQGTVAASAIKATVPSDASGQDSRNFGNRSFTAPQSTPQASAPASVPDADAADVAQIAALARQTQAPAQAASRPADVAPPTLPPADLPAPETAVDAAPSATPREQAKSDGRSRPLANVAPGLTIAAQVTAQQTPEQASAAEKLAQLAAAKTTDVATVSDVASRDAASVPETTASPTRVEQTPQADVTTPRNMTIDVASAASSARHVRPAFHPLVAQVAVHVAQAAADGNDRISIRLSPAELGRIDVRLDFGPDGRVQAVFAADRPQTVELLQRDARDLERALQDAGLRADSGSLSFNLRGDGRNGSPSFTDALATDRRDGPVAEIPLPQVQAYAAGSAASGRLDIRI